MTIKPLRTVVLGACALLCGTSLARAQSTSPFTVLSNNADIANKKLYVEVMYEKPTCSDYKAQFRLASKNNPTGNAIAVDSFLNNLDTYETEHSGADKYKSLMRPTAGGYRLRFALPANASVDSGYRICVDAYEMPYRCKGCAAGGSDAIFGSDDIDPACPYKGVDLLACYKRESKEANWEAWIQDARDCQPYRIVAMPDGKWWMAQNLNYQKDLMGYASANSGPGAAPATADAGFWCPGGKSFTTASSVTDFVNADATSGGLPACNTYGALYSWTTANSLNGRGAIGAQGICPAGWLMPTSNDWGVLLNAAEGCSSPLTADGVSPCNHLRSDATTVGFMGSNNLKAVMKATQSCLPHTNNVDSVCAKADLPSWTWRRADYKSKLATPLALGNDRYGFMLYPAGNRTEGKVFGYAGTGTYFWSATVSAGDNSRSLSRNFTNDEKTVALALSRKDMGMSVRCVSAESAEKNFFIYPAGGAGINMAADAGSLTLSAQSLGAGWTYTWTPATLASGVTLTSSGNTATIMNGTPNGMTVGATYNVMVTAKKAGEVDLTTSKTITVVATPPVELPSLGLAGIYVDKNPVSRNAVVKFSAYSSVQPAGVTYTWTATSRTAGAPVWNLSGANTATISSTAPIVSGNSSYTITLTMKANNYKTATTNIEVVVRGCDALVQGSMPADQLVCPGAILSTPLNPTLGGGDESNRSIQWQQRLGSGSWTNIAGAISAGYTPTASSTTSTVIYYRRTVTSCDQINYSPEAKITTYNRITQPAALALKTSCTGGSLTHSYGVALGVSSSFSYKWEESNNNVDFTPVATNGTSQNLTYTVSGTNNTEMYHRRIVTSTACLNMSDTSVSHPTKVLNSGPSFTFTYADASVCPGGTYTMPTVTINAPAGGTVSGIQWQKLNNSTPWVDEGGKTAVAYGTATASTTAGAQFYFRLYATTCGVTNYSGNVLRLLAQGITSNPTLPAQFVCPNASFRLDPAAAAAAANTTVTYKWQKADALNGGYSDISAYSANKYLDIIAPATEGTSVFYRRVARGTCTGGAVSEMVSDAISVTATVAITQVSLPDMQVCAGDSVMLNLAAATGVSGITYQWQRFDVNTNAWADVPVSGTTQNYMVAAPDAGKCSIYRRMGTAPNCGSIASNSAKITSVQASVSVASNLRALYETSPGIDVVLSPAISGQGTITYQWYSSLDNDVFSPVVGETKPTLTVKLTNEGEYSPYYRLTATVACGNVISTSNVTRVSVPLNCPYQGRDMIDGTCEKRTMGAKNWQATIIDARDGKEYRIVQMPGGDWWFAENLAHKNGAEGVDWQYNFENDPSYYENLGLQYPHHNQPCPVGWKPSEKENWENMLNCASGDCKSSAYIFDFDQSVTSKDYVVTSLLAKLRTTEWPWRLPYHNTNNPSTTGTDDWGFSMRSGGYGASNTDANNWTSYRISTKRVGSLFFGYMSGQTQAVIRHHTYGYEGLKLCCQGMGSYVRCIADTLVTNSSAPTTIEATYLTLANNAAPTMGTTTLTASGGTAASGSVYRWGTGSVVGGNVISGQNTAVLADQSPVTTTTYWVQRSNSDGTWASGAATIEIKVQACPYTVVDRTNLQQCRQRGSGAKNWEAYFKDARDSKVYRAVRMPDGRWWMAQNLNYQKDLTYYDNPALPTTSETDVTLMTAGAYWCPQAVYVGDGYTVAPGGVVACNTWGAIYPWSTIMRDNGTNATIETPTDAVPGTVKGICPTGWHVPSYKEFTQMWDCVEGVCGSGLHNGYSATMGTAGQKLRGRAIGVATPTNMVWNNNNASNGTDEFGFSLYSGGVRQPAGTGFGMMGLYSYMWTSSVYLSDATYAMFAHHNSTNVGSYFSHARKSYGMQLRCVSDNTSAVGVPSTPPSHIIAEYTGVSLGASTTLNAIGAAPSSGAKYQWGRGDVVGLNAITPTTTEGKLAITPTSVTDSIFWVRMVESDNTTYIGGITISIRVQPVTCPYVSGDIVAGTCKQRNSGAKNWTVQFTDSRDGQVYPAVLMPDGRWWMAKNLNYTTALKNAQRVDQPSTITSGDWNVYKSYYWCPSSTFDSGDMDEMCARYGPMYPWQTVMSEDGIGATNKATEAVPSNVRGVCPLGWHVPSMLEASYMANCVEGNCLDITLFPTTSDKWVGSYIGAHLRGNTFNPYQGMATNDSYGFSAQANGYRSTTFGAQKQSSYIWLSSEYGPNDGSVFLLNYSNTGAYLTRNHNKYHGMGVRCVSDGEASSPASSTAPERIASTILISGVDVSNTNGAYATLSAVGGLAERGASYRWGTGVTIGSNILTGETGESITRQINAASNTYWVQRVSPTTGIVAQGITITIPTQRCPYTATDLVNASCAKVAETNRWEAAIVDSRPLSKRATYPIAQVGRDNKWWTMAALKYGDCTTSGSVLTTGRCIDCSDIYFYNATAALAGSAAVDGTNVQGLCPMGWRLPGLSEAPEQLSSVRREEFGVGEQSVVSYATSNCDRCWGNANMHYWHSGGRVYYWLNDLRNVLFELTVGPRGEAFAIRCISSNTTSATKPTSISGPDHVANGSTATLTAVGATLGTGAYEWAINPNFNPVISGATSVSYTTTAINAATTFYVRVVENGTPTEAASRTLRPVTILSAAACPYKGADMVANSCYAAPAPEVGYRAKIEDVRDNKVYDITSINGKWWMGQNVDWDGTNAGVGTGTAGTAVNCPNCNGKQGRLYSRAKASGGAAADGGCENTAVGTKQGICPAGWHIPTAQEVYNGWYQIFNPSIPYSEFASDGSANGANLRIGDANYFKPIGGGGHVAWDDSKAIYGWNSYWHRYAADNESSEGTSLMFGHNSDTFNGTPSCTQGGFGYVNNLNSALFYNNTTSSNKLWRCAAN